MFKKPLHKQQRCKSGAFYRKHTDPLSVEADIIFPEINISKCLKNSHLKSPTLIFWSYHNQVPQSGCLNQYSIFILNSEIEKLKLWFLNFFSCCCDIISLDKDQLSVLPSQLAGPALLSGSAGEEQGQV